MTDMADKTATTDGEEDLRLAVLDEEDLAVVSAHLQNADASLVDMAYLPREKRFALVVDRFDWPAALRGRFARRRTGLHFERVMQAARSGFAPSAMEAPATQLLAMTFEAKDPPAGVVNLTFADGARIRLTVECLEAEMRDLGERWTVDGRPTAPAGKDQP